MIKNKRKPNKPYNISYQDLTEYLGGGTLDQNSNTSQDFISKAGPWGAVIGTASKLGTTAMDSMINYDSSKMSSGETIAAATKTGIFNPAAGWTDPNLSGKDKVISGLLPGLGGIKSAKAKKRIVAEQKNLQNMAIRQQQGQELLQSMQMQNPQQSYMPVAKCGGRLRRYANGGPLTTVDSSQRATADSVKVYQGLLTQALADKTKGKVNIDSVLTSASNNPNFNRFKIPDYAQQLIETSGDYALTPEEQKEVLGTDYDKYVKAVKNYRTNVGNYSNAVNTKGNLEVNPDVSQENFGYRNMLERMPWSKEEGTPYAYLKNKLPKKAMGGTLNYKGQLHEGPDGGNPVDGKGNVNLNNPTALVQKGEVSYNTEDGSTYIFSDNLYLNKNKTFAKEAKRIQSKYSRRLGKNMIEKHDELASKGYNMDMKDLLDKQEQVREINGVADNMEKLFGGAVEENQLTEQMKYGGTIHIKPENRGKFTEYKKRTGKTTEEALHSKNPHVRKMAQFAKNARKWKHEMGGNLPRYDGGGRVPVAGEDFKFDNRDYLSSDWGAPMENNSGYNNNYTAAELGTGLDLTPDVYTRNQNVSGKSVKELEGWKPDTGMDWQSAAGLIAPIAGSIINAATRRNPKKIRIDQSISTPKGISLERERAVLREQANLARANSMRDLKAGTSAQQYLSNVGAVQAGIQRGLGQQLGESYEKEEMYNNQVGQQNASREAQLKEMQLQADMYNSQLDAHRNALKQADITNIVNALNMYGRDVTQSKRDMNYLQMMDPRYRIMSRRRKWYSPKETEVQINPDNIIG